MTSPAVTLRHVGRVAQITLNQPQTMNALNGEIADAFGRVVDDIQQNHLEKTGCVVITGASNFSKSSSGKQIPPAFSAGGDLNWLRARGSDTPARNAQIMHEFYWKFLRIRHLPVPTIAAINGAAIGAGLCLALACDMRVASESAKMGLTFVGLGLHPGMGATHFLPTIAGAEVANRMLLSGDIITGKEAKAIGLVGECVGDGDVGTVSTDSPTLKRALQIAEKIANQAPVAVRTCTRSLRNKQELGLEQALWREADAQAQCYANKDLVEGVSAVAEKRKPVFDCYEAYDDGLERAKL